MTTIKKLRKLHHISQIELAQKIGVTQGAVSQWETGEAKPALENLIAIARFWGEEVFVGILSTEDKDVTIRLPLGAVGASVPKREIFGKGLDFAPLDETSIQLTVKAHQAYFMECQMR